MSTSEPGLAALQAAVAETVDKIKELTSQLVGSEDPIVATAAQEIAVQATALQDRVIAAEPGPPPAEPGT
jgi:hypothetical protein